MAEALRERQTDHDGEGSWGWDRHRRGTRGDGRQRRPTRQGVSTRPGERFPVKWMVRLSGGGCMDGLPGGGSFSLGRRSAAASTINTGLDRGGDHRQTTASLARIMGGEEETRTARRSGGQEDHRTQAPGGGLGSGVEWARQTRNLRQLEMGSTTSSSLSVSLSVCSTTTSDDQEPLSPWRSGASTRLTACPRRPLSTATRPPGVYQRISRLDACISLCPPSSNCRAPPHLDA